MRSYGLGIAFCMVLAAIYAYQNASELIVRFIVWERALPQGVWEITLFAVGAIAMWIISLSAVLEIKKRHSKLLKDQKETIGIMENEISDLRDERNSLIIALKKSGDYPPSTKEEKKSELWRQDVQTYTCGDAEKKAPSEENIPSSREALEEVPTDLEKDLEDEAGRYWESSDNEQIMDEQEEDEDNSKKEDLY